MSDLVPRLNAALEGRYVIERELGHGGMATVYLAEDIKHDRKVALKVLKPELAAVVGAERFLAEIKTTANLQHPHILPLFDSGEADSFVFYVMPYIEGESLRDRLDREHQLPVDEAVKIATDLAEALDYAHRHAVIHRDIKPANILMHEGRPLIADFGIALAVGTAGGGRLTETGLSLGTPYYMSPEQATGEQFVGEATDTYALGVVLYEMLVGDPPFMGSTAQAVLGQIIAGGTVSATEKRASVPANVEAALLCALEKLPADRFSSTEKFASALADEHFRYGEMAARGGAGAAAGPWNRLTVAMTATTIAFAGVAAWALFGPGQPEAPRPVERFAQPFGASQMPTLGALGLPAFTLSPDGSTLVYLAEGDPGRGNPRPHLRVRRWDQLESTSLPSTDNAMFPSISPHGGSFSFGGAPGSASDLMTPIQVASLDGGPLRTLVQSAAGYSYWGADDYVYFVAESGAAARIPSSGGAIEVVTEVGEEETGSFHVIRDLVRDNQVALYSSTDVAFSNPEMRAIDLLTGETTVIGPGLNPNYTPTGHLIYTSVDSTLMAARFDVDRLQITGTPVAMMEGAFGFTVSDSGKLFHGSANSSEYEFVWVTRDGAAVPVERGWKFSDGANVNRRLSLSPDGNRLAYRAVENGNFDIWVKDLGGGPPTRLTFNESGDRRPTWTPDGQMVTFVSTREGDWGAWSLFSKSADGTGTAELLYDHDKRIGDAIWSPDGASLIIRTFIEGSDRGDILVARPGIEDPPRPLLAEEHQETSPAISPNGRWLAYVSDETGVLEVFVTPFLEGESGKWQVSTNGGGGPAWSNDGSEIFFFNGNSEMVAARVEAEDAFRVLERSTLFTAPSTFLPGASQRGAVFDVAADGRFLMARHFLSDDLAGTRWVLINNWFEELKDRVGN
jgi:eukaryotic-like serine/threonine-protein kinase